MINRFVGVGRLTKQPELRYTPQGTAVCRFTLAINRTFTNAEGQREADFINCIVWRKQAENVASFLDKGSLAGVEGRIQTSSFDGQDGKKVFITEVNCDSVQFLEPKNSGGNNQSNYQPNNQNTQTGNDTDPFANDSQPIDINEDDLPFDK